MSKKPALNLSSFTGLVSQASGQSAPDAELDISLIYTQAQVRTEMGDLSELANSIEEQGVLAPIIVHASVDGRYRVIAGERRFRACLQINKKKIPAIIKRGLSELQIRQIQVTENNDRENLSAFDEAMGVAQDVEEFGFAQAVSIWNRSEAWVSKRVAVKKYAQPVVDLLVDRLCSDLEILHSLNQLIAQDASEFDKFALALRDGHIPTRDEVRNKVATVKQLKKEREAQAAVEAASTNDAPGKNSAAAGSMPISVPSSKQQDKQNKQDADLAKMREKSVSNGKNKAGQVASPSPALDSDPTEDIEQSREHLQFQAIHNSTNAFQSLLGLHSTLDKEKAEDKEWVMWATFEAAALRLLNGVDDDRWLIYLKRLQTELKGKSPHILLDELHGGDYTTIPKKPEGWSL